MMVTLAGAMSTAELGISLAEMIRQDKIDIISCTGANLEEDIMNLVAHSHYKRVPNYRDLSPQDEWDLLEKHYNRLPIPVSLKRKLSAGCKNIFIKYGKMLIPMATAFFRMNLCTKILLSGELEQYYEIDPKIHGCWLLQKRTCLLLYRDGKTVPWAIYLPRM